MRQKGVSVPVKEHHDPLGWDPVGSLLEAEVKTGGYAAHVPDLEVEHHQHRLVGGHSSQHLGAGMHSDHLMVTTQGCGYLVVDVVGVGGHKHRGPGGRRRRGGLAHGRERTRGVGDRCRPTPTTLLIRTGPIRTLNRQEANSRLEITIERHDGYALCRPAGELDAYTVAQFREALTDLAVESYVLVDLSDVPFMDSAGLGALIGGIRRARENDGDVAVACNRPALTRLLHTTGFDRIVPVRETVEEAVLALGEATD